MVKAISLGERARSPNQDTANRLLSIRRSIAQAMTLSIYSPVVYILMSMHKCSIRRSHTVMPNMHFQNM